MNEVDTIISTICFMYELEQDNVKGVAKQINTKTGAIRYIALFKDNKAMEISKEIFDISKEAMNE